MDKRPRHYASEIIEAERPRRLGMLEKVPDQYREWVRFYVEDYFLKKRLKK